MQKLLLKKKKLFLYILLNSYKDKTDVFDKPLYKFIDKYIDKYSVQLCKKFILI